MKFDEADKDGHLILGQFQILRQRVEPLLGKEHEQVIMMQEVLISKWVLCLSRKGRIVYLLVFQCVLVQLILLELGKPQLLAQLHELELLYWLPPIYQLEKSLLLCRVQVNVRHEGHHCVDVRLYVEGLAWVVAHRVVSIIGFVRFTLPLFLGTILVHIIFQGLT